MDTRTWMRYWRRAVWVSRFLRFVPFVRMVGLNGSMVTGQFTAGSDIDLYIVTKDGHIFVSRVLVTGLLTLLGVRRTSKKVAGRICDNRFAVESFVDITPHDAYHARVFHNLIPLFDTGVYERYGADNSWMKELGESVVSHKPLLHHNAITRIVQRIGESIVGLPALELWVEARQMERFYRDVRAHLPGSKVVISKRELRFHLAKEVHG